MNNDQNKEVELDNMPHYIMGSEPLTNASIEEIRKMAENIQSEKELAALYAATHNEAWWVEDDVYDYEKGTPEYEKACKITDDWFEIADSLRDKIFDILKAEGVAIPEKGYIVVLKPFMDRNGYFDGNGWWLLKEEYKDFPEGSRGVIV